MSSIEKKKSTIALVGRPNVGKSTLFNVLTNTRRALVGDRSGVTRDRRFGWNNPEDCNGRVFSIMDTGGWIPKNLRAGEKEEVLMESIESQIILGIEEASLVLLVVDVRQGKTMADEQISQFLLKHNCPFIVLANKSDSFKQSNLEFEFHGMGAKAIFPVSGEHRRGIGDLWTAVDEFLSPLPTLPVSVPIPSEKPIRVGIVGRPNVGKSSLLNTLLGEERVVTSSIPGTTTDPVDVSFTREEQEFLLLDTAGIRRHSKRTNIVEQLAVMYAERNVKSVDLVFLVLDAMDGITSQDARVAAIVHKSGCGTIIIANKWDLAPKEVRRDSQEQIGSFVKIIRKELPFLNYAPVLAFSCKRSKVYAGKMGVGAEKSLPKDMMKIWSLVKELVEERKQKVFTSDLNRLVQKCIHSGPNISQNVGKIYFAHQLGGNSPTFCAHVRNPTQVPKTYQRYLERATRERYGFRGYPIRWVFRGKESHKART